MSSVKGSRKAVGKDTDYGTLEVDLLVDEQVIEEGEVLDDEDAAVHDAAEDGIDADGVDPAKTAHDNAVVASLYNQAIAKSTAAGITMTETTRKAALGIFPKVRQR